MQRTCMVNDSPNTSSQPRGRLEPHFRHLASEDPPETLGTPDPEESLIEPVAK